jgi:hypothetical protein
MKTVKLINFNFQLSIFNLFKNLYILLFLLMYSCVSAQVDNSGNFSDRVFAYICKKDIKHPHIAMQQAIIETGGFTQTMQ